MKASGKRWTSVDRRGAEQRPSAGVTAAGGDTPRRPAMCRQRPTDIGGDRSALCTKTSSSHSYTTYYLHVPRYSRPTDGRCPNQGGGQRNRTATLRADDCDGAWRRGRRYDARAAGSERTAPRDALVGQTRTPRRGRATGRHHDSPSRRHGNNLKMQQRQVNDTPIRYTDAHQ